MKFRILKYNQDIIRGKKSKKGKKGVKLYDGKTVPFLPKNWETKKTQLKIKDVLKGKVNHIIVPHDTLIVIDCDDKQAIKEVSEYTGKKDYIVGSDDANSKHFYFKPTKYSKKTLGVKRRKTTNKIDLLMGESLIFTPNKHNKTKTVEQGRLDKLTPIPKKLVDYIASKMKKETKYIIEAGDRSKYTPTAYLGDELKKALRSYKRYKDFDDLALVFEYLTPMQYKNSVGLFNHPNDIPDGEGVHYLQALIAKMGSDPTISLKQAKELITLIATKLWDDPLPNARLKVLLDSIPKQTYADGTPVFTYDKEAKKSMLLVKEDGYPAFPLYRTNDDTYLVFKHSKIAKFPTFIAFKKYVLSSGVTAVLNGKPLKTLKEVHIESIKTVDVVNTIDKPQGLHFDNKDYTYYYNLFEHAPSFELLRYGKVEGTVKSKIKKGRIVLKTPKNIKNIKRLLLNICADHENPDIQVTKVLLFLAKKLVSLEYSPIVFLTLGAEGTGKSLFTNMLGKLTNGVAEVILDANFNSEYEQALFFYEDEGKFDTDMVNKVKKISGNSQIRIEAKNKDAYRATNNGTIIINSNRYTTIADTKDNRRYAHLLSFTAKPIKDRGLFSKIKSELMDFAIYLKKIYNTKELREYMDDLYYHSAMWGDKASEDIIINKLEQRIMKNNYVSDNREEALGVLVQKYKDMDGHAINAQLEYIFGKDYQFWTNVDRRGSGKVVARVPFMLNTIITIKGVDITNNYLAPTKLSEYGILVDRTYQYKGTPIANIKLPLEMFLKCSDFVNKKNVLIFPRQWRILTAKYKANFIKDISKLK